MSEHEEYKETWFIVPRSIIDIQGVTLSYLKVFETIFQFWNKGKKCFLSNPEIARRTGLKVSVIKEAIAFFEKNMELERIQIGLKRYLMQPLKVVEIPGLEIVPKEVAANVATCSKDTQVAADAATCGRKRGQVVAANVATEIKNLNKEIKKDPPISPKGDCSDFSFSKMIEDNPFNLPIEMIEDWMKVRKTKKAKMTPTAWKATNRVLGELRNAGLNPLECFETVVASGWQGIKFSYFEKEIAALKPKQPSKYVPKEDRAAEYEKIAAREREAEQRKKEEIEASKGFKDIVKEAKEKISFKERLRLYKLEQERIKNEVDNI